MKAIALSLLVLLSRCCLAEENTNVLFASDWSEPTYSPQPYSTDEPIRGRLLILDGTEPAYGGPPTTNRLMMFVELQNAKGACCGSVKLFFNVMGLKCELKNSKGESAPKPQGMGWSGRGAFAPSWVVLPYNSTLRLFVNPGNKSPVQITETGEPWSYWSIPSSDTNVYYLSASLTISTPTNATLTATPHREVDPHEYAEWTGKLVFPKIKICASELVKQK